MDLFAKIDQFERLALEALDPELDVRETETIDEYTAQQVARREASAERLKKLTQLGK